MALCDCQQLDDPSWMPEVFQRGMVRTCEHGNAWVIREGVWVVLPRIEAQRSIDPS